MSAELFALLAAVGWGAEAIFIRKGSRYAPVSLAALMSFVLTAMVLLAINLSRSTLEFFFTYASFYFIASGLIQPAVVRILQYTAIVRLGASRAGPIRGISPLFAIFIAILALGEEPGPTVYVGTVMCVGGLWLISYRRAGETPWRTIDLLFPLSAAFLAAISQNIRRSGLLILPDPFVGAAVTTLTSLLVLTGSLTVTRQWRRLQINRECLPGYGGAAVISAVAQILVFIALSKGEVSVVMPLINSNPLFIVLFSAVFLRDLEKVTAQVAAGAFLIVGGITLILYR
ncbi:MAG: DMT family transporter [Deltaproteobacteria bacterium]|nr:DMT family transporter [Deltaproteobacteria bacterium]